MLGDTSKLVRPYQLASRLTRLSSIAMDTNEALLRHAAVGLVEINPAADVQRLPCDEGGQVGGKEHGRADNIVRIAEPFQRSDLLQ